MGRQALDRSHSHFPNIPLPSNGLEFKARTREELQFALMAQLAHPVIQSVFSVRRLQRLVTLRLYTAKRHSRTQHIQLP
jgi:hypothetical protein